ncbi:MAG: UbiA prenyltransferase family protein [Planctomycetota bacterium]|nr:UbiA prenyltransferase family protein [Planctomycetota bacterium]
MPPLQSILRLLRPGDWTKNVFVLLPLVFWSASTGRDADSATMRLVIEASLIAFSSFCLAASGWYCLNDAMDVEEDRLHPKKQHRPVASGAVSVRCAVTLGIVLLVSSIGVAAMASKAAAAVMVLYCLMQGAYNIRLKRTTFVDVATIASGFCLRAIAGAAASGIPISPWLLLCVFFLTLYLGLIKRAYDMTTAIAADSKWKQRAGYGDVRELDWLMGITAAMTVLMYVMYAMSDHAHRLYGVRAFGLALLSPIVLLALQRFHKRAMQGRSDSPLAALREDALIRIAILGWALGSWVVLYWAPIVPILDRLLI